MIKSMKLYGIRTMILIMVIARRIISPNSSLICQATIREAPHPMPKLDVNLNKILEHKALLVYSSKVCSDKPKSLTNLKLSIVVIHALTLLTLEYLIRRSAQIWSGVAKSLLLPLTLNHVINVRLKS